MAGRATFKKGDKVTRVEQGLKDPKVALKQIGILMVAESQRAFKSQKWSKKNWTARAAPNVYGIISDFAQGRKSPPGRRFQTRPALIDTGRLRGSISFRVMSPVVEVGTNLKYAAVHQKGGKIKSEKITKPIQSAIAKWLKGAGRQWEKKLGWITNARYTNKTLTGRVEARPFVGITRNTRKVVEKAVGVKIMEVRS